MERRWHNDLPQTGHNHQQVKVITVIGQCFRMMYFKPVDITQISIEIEPFLIPTLKEVYLLLRERSKSTYSVFIEGKKEITLVKTKPFA